MEGTFVVDLAEGGTHGPFGLLRGGMYFRDEGQSAIGPRESHHWFRDERVLDGVEGLQGCWVEWSFLVHVLSCEAMQGLRDQGKILDVIAEEITQTNECPDLSLAGRWWHVTEDG